MNNKDSNNKGGVKQLSKLSISMRTINNNLQILSKLAAAKKRTNEFTTKEATTQNNTKYKNNATPPIPYSFSSSSLELERLFDTTFKAICDLEIFEVKLNLKRLDLEKALLNLIKKLIDFELERLFDTTFKAICDLEIFEVKLNLKRLDLEKALLNLIKKLIDFGQNKKAIELLVKLRSRLSQLFGIENRLMLNLTQTQNMTRQLYKNHHNNSSSNNNNNNSNNSNNFINNNQQKFVIKNFDFNSVKNLMTFYIDLCTFPINNNDNRDIHEIDQNNQNHRNHRNNQNLINSETKLLVLSSLVCAMRCLIELDDNRFTKVLPKLLKDNNGNPMTWAILMKDIDSILVNSYLEVIIRVISKACNKLQNLSVDASMNILRLRAVSIKAFTLTTRYELSLLLDYIFSYSIQYEKTQINNEKFVIYQELLTFHEEAYKILEQHISLAVQNPKFFKWLEHFARVARMKIIDALSRLLNTNKEIIHNSQIIILKLNIASFVLENLFIVDHAFDVTTRLQNARNSVNHFLDILKYDDNKNNKNIKVQGISQFFQSVELLRRPLIKIIEFIEEKGITQITEKKNKNDININKKEEFIKLNISNQNSFFLNSLRKQLHKQSQRHSQRHSVVEDNLDNSHQREESVAISICISIKELIKKITYCLSIVCKDYFKEYKDYYINNKDSVNVVVNTLLHPEKLPLISIDIYELLSRFTFSFFNNNNNSKNKFINYYDHIEKEEKEVKEEEEALKISQYTFCIEGLRTISNLYYRKGVYYYNNNQIKEAIKPISESCKILNQYIQELQRVGDDCNNNNCSVEEIQLHLSKRFEILGICWNLVDEINHSRNAFESSLKNIPKSEFQKFGSLISSQTIFSVSQNAPTIPKLIDRYIKLLLLIVDSNNSNKNTNNNKHISSLYEILLNCKCDNFITLAGLFEYELRVIKSLEDKFDGLELEMILYDKLLEWYDYKNFPIRRARSLIEVSKISRRVNIKSNAIELIEEAVNLLKTDDLAQDSNLAHLRYYYLATAYSWMGIFGLESGNLTFDPFNCALNLWKRILIDIPLCFDTKVISVSSSQLNQYDQLEDAKRNIDDVERFYGHLEMLADYFALINLPINHILTIKLMLRLNNGIRKDANNILSDSVICYSCIGKIYLSLGYTGKAGLALSQAKGILDSCDDDDDSNNNNNAKLYWMLVYSYYLCLIGNMEKSCIQFNQTKKISELWNNNNNNKVPDTSSRNRKKYDQSLLAEAYLTRSYITIRMGNLEDAINCCTESIRIFNRLIRNISRNSSSMKLLIEQRRRQETNNNNDNSFLVEDHQSVATIDTIDSTDTIDEQCVNKNKINKNNNNNNTTGDFVLKSSAQKWKWRVSQKLLECYNQLGRLHILRGGVKEAEYMFKQASQLIETVVQANPSFTSHFLLNLAELEYRKHCWKESEEKLLKVLEYQQMVQVFQKETAQAKLCLGDFKCREGDFLSRRGGRGIDFDDSNSNYQDQCDQCYDLATEYYQHANEIMNDIMKYEFISNIERMDSTNVFQIPRCRKLLSNQISSPMSKESNEDLIQFECLLLSNMKSELYQHQGWLLSKRGNLDEGLNLIELGRISNQSRLEKAEYFHFLGKAKILNFTNMLMQQNRLVFENIQDSVLSLPLFTKSIKPQKSRKVNLQQSTKEKKISLKLLEEVNQAIDYLINVYDLSYECGLTQTLQETGLYITRANIINIYLQNQYNVDQVEIASICAFYLEMTKALTAKREMIALFNGKLKLPFSNDNSRWPQQFTNPLSYQDDDKGDNKDDESLVDEETKSRKDFIKTLSMKYEQEKNLTYKQFHTEFLDILPYNWTVCSISIDIETNDMYVCRYRQKISPLLLRLPLKRQSSREEYCNTTSNFNINNLNDDNDDINNYNNNEDEVCCFSYDEVIKEFNTILELSNQSMKIGKNERQNKWEKLKWWKERKQLDDRMKLLLENIENFWFGGFKGILITHTQENPELFSFFKEMINNLISKNEIRKTSSQSPYKMNNSNNKQPQLEIEEELYRSFLRLGTNVTDQDIEDIIYFLVDVYNKCNDQQIGYDEIDWDQLTEDFRDILSNVNNSNNNSSSEDFNDQHIILILDKNVQMLPWESLPCLRNQPVSRLPSLSFLRDRILSIQHHNIPHNINTNNRRQKNQRNIQNTENTEFLNHMVNKNNCYYVLNPSQDLKNTQKEFETFVKSFQNWDGVIGHSPFEQEIKNGLSNQDLYIYFGHGSGEQYIRNHHIRSLDRCAVTLLLGCSSGHLKNGGEFDPSGAALSYMIAGCPALVANLWDVTDKDIDRFSKALFKNWELNPNESKKGRGISLVQAVSKSRNECVLKYLIGSAPVVYGIPCYLT
ncbi:hypothetical protein Glove_89g107 [Diversispora epigaea]|uniref:separase n=1 Tax=Diversispora epigaea TaxID=1348612 RepID=A0A397J5Q4_9GLOM|nr:hypothetical protein Glove_89g107 [Diversispora epigaea]